MGSCKDNMKSTKSSDNNSSSGIFGRFKKKQKDSEKNPETLADILEKADQVLSKLITVKESDLKNEDGKEVENAVSLSRLKSMMWHLEQMVEIASDYGN